MIIKFIKKKINSIKICAVFTTVCFLVSTLGANLYAIPMAENANQKYEDVFNKASSISAEYGKITSSRDGNSDITIINIQDLHCHPQTQRNISKIIAQIAEKYNLKEIYVEGGYGNIDLNWLTSIKDENIRKQVTEKLLEEGLLTGSEYYKLTSGNKDVELKGIDEEDLHRDNVKRLAWIIENQNKYKDVIKKVENEINILEKMYVNSRNERFNRDIEKYLTNEIDTRRFYRQLIKYVKDINANPDKYNNITAIRLEDYPNIVKFITLRKISKDIDVRKVTQQLQAVINELKNRLPYNVYTQLLKETENLSDSQKVVELITLLCKKEGIDLEYKYKALNDFLQSNEINRELNTVELVYEERQLITEIRKALSYNNEEYEITFVSDFSRFFKDYLEYKLTDADWKYFESGYEQFRQLYAKYATIDRIEEVEEDFAELNKYYGINDIRNEVFVNNLLQDKHPDVMEQSKFREDEEILRGSREVIIAVTGGFHSNALEDILQAKEVNTIVITPSIFEGIEKATKQYKGIIKEQSKEFQHQALAYRILSSLKDQEQRIYLYGALKSLLGDNINKLKEVLGEDVDLDSLEKELQNLQLSSDEQSQLKVNRTVQFLESVADAIINDPLFPKEGGKAVFVPNVNEIILKVSETLVDAGIFLSNGPIFAAEQRGLPYLKEIAPEIYSRMPAFIQEALLATEGFIAEESYKESVSEEDGVVEKDTQETEEPEIIAEEDDEEKEEKVDSSYLTEERKAELLGRFYNNNKEAFYRLINICCRESVNFDLSKDSPLLDMFIRKYNSYGYDLDTMDEIIRRSVKVAETFFFDADLKFFAFEKFIDYFEDDDIGDNGEIQYINFFRKLFSLSKENLEFLCDEKVDGTAVTDLVYYYEAEDIDNNLAFLLKRYRKELSKLTDFSRLVNLFDNIDKLNSLSEQEFADLISLPNKIFFDILDSSEDASQLKTKLTVGKKFYFKGYDEDTAKALYANAEKIQGLSAVDFQRLMSLNKEALFFVLENVKNSSDISNILTFYKGMGLSPNFDNTEGVKDFTDPRFKALVKYISVISDRDFYSELFSTYDEDALKLIANSIDDANFVKEYLLNPNYRNTYKNLFAKITELEIKNLAVENDYLALKLILNKDFNRILTESRIDNISDRQNLVARYYSAIAVSRFMYDGAEQELVYYSFEDTQFIELMKEVTDTYIEMMRAMLNNVLIDADTKIYALCNPERVFSKNRFNMDSLKEILDYMGIPETLSDENIYRRIGNNTRASERWLDAIKNFIMDSAKTKGYFVFRGHGDEEALVVYDPGAVNSKKRIDNGLATGNKSEQITPKQLADALYELATRSNNPVDLRNITIDLSCCNSYFFARNVFDLLEQRFKEEQKEETYPTIITAAGLETKFGYTDLSFMEGNLHKGINKLIKSFQKGSVPVLSLGMIGVSEYLFRKSNITMFTSFYSKEMLKRIAKTKEKIAKFNNSQRKIMEAEPESSGEEEEAGSSVMKKKVKFLPRLVAEASVSKGDKTAPIWEEMLYRAIPAMVFSGVILALTMLFPAIPAIGVIAKLVSVGVFAFIQTKFIKAHIVTDWLEAMDAGGPILKDILENKDLSFKEKLSKAAERIKERLFVIFPNSTAERSFYRYYTINRQAITHREGLIIPTMVFAVPYIAAIVFFNSMPAIAVATVLSMAFHYINNLIARTIEEKEKLEAQHLSGEFLDIQKRLRHIELIVENPQMKNDLPEIKVGPLALTFGLEKQKERRNKSLTEFRNIIDTLKKNIETELSKIDKKKRKTKKDKEKIAELKEELELIQKEYPTIITESGEEIIDTTKIEGTINKINKLLAVFEEIENILNAIETFRYNNGDNEETRELEREFLDFTERTLMRELMSLYDEKVTGVHVRRVVSFAKFIGKKMPFGNDLRMMYKLMLSSVLHDIGKNLVPESILNKQGTFNDFERDIMEFHVVFGGLILRSSILKRLSYTAENHHYTNNSPRSYSFKTKMDRMFGSSDYEYNEEEAQIAKIVTLADVFEAVSPKLSFDSERTYQFSKKIRDISDMLEKIEEDIELTESQKKEVIILLAEIAQIDAEEDAEQKRAMEQDFIRKVLYAHSRSVVLNYIREKNNELIRTNAFRVIFTETPQFIFTKLGKTEAEFMADFRKDPEGTVDKCMSLVDESKFEFDTEVIRAFLVFYFSAEDININNAIIESLNREKESALVVYIKDVSYSIYKFFRRIKYTLIRFAPVIASISHEQQTDFEKYFEGNKVFLQRFITEDGVERVRSFEVLKFGKSSIQRIVGRFEVPVYEKDYDSLGIIVEKDSDGNIVSVKAKEGYGFSSLLIDGEPVGDEKNNLNFSLGQISAMLRDLKILNADAPDIKEDEMDKYVARIYLDDSKEDLEKAMEDAIKNNKLMVIHVFRKGFSTKGLTLGQIRDKYVQAYSLLQSDKLKNLPILSGAMQLERDVELDPYITFDFFLKELLKNHFGHGNYGLFEYPIACYISADGSRMITYDSSLDLGKGQYTSPFGSEEFKKRGITIGVLDDLMKETLIHGDGKGRKMMAESKTRKFEDSRHVNDSRIGGYRFFKATVTLKLETEEQIEAAKQYKKEQDAKARTVTSSSTEDKESELYSFGESSSKTSSSASKATAEDWADFWGTESILKPFGWKLGEYPHIWEEALFRYLPTALILSGHMGYLFGLGLQVVFILAHPIAKWIAEKRNGNKVGIGDLFKKIGKTYLGLPTLAMMLPYIGTLLAFAINPALSIIITPVFFMFADVIVQWLTRKDSGGKININANSVITLAIASLAGYAVLPFIPVIHPLVNALINPIVITNFFGAGRLHYEYNKRQENRDRKLSLLGSGVDEEEGENIDDSDQTIRAIERINNGLTRSANRKFSIKDFKDKFFGRKSIRMQYRNGSQETVDLSPKYKISRDDENYRMKKSDGYFGCMQRSIFEYKLRGVCDLYDDAGTEMGKVKFIRYTAGDKIEFVYDNGETETVDKGQYKLKLGEDVIEFKLENGSIKKLDEDGLFKSVKGDLWLKGFSSEQKMFIRYKIAPKKGYELVAEEGDIIDKYGNMYVDFETIISRSVKVIKTKTKEEITIELIRKYVDFRTGFKIEQYLTAFKGDGKRIRSISNARETIGYSDIDEQLRSFGITNIVYDYEGRTITLTFVINGVPTQKTVEFFTRVLDANGNPVLDADGNEQKEDQDTAYLNYNNHIFYFEREYCAPTRVYDIEDIDVFGQFDTNLDFEFNSDVLDVEIERGFRLEDFKDKKFVLRRKNQDPVMLYFDSKKNALYEYTTASKRKRIKTKNLRKQYGIISFKYEAGKITELILEEGASIQIDVRQPREMDEDKIKGRMSELLSSSTGRDLSGLSTQELRTVLKRACPDLTDEELKTVFRGKPLSNKIKEKIYATNYQGEVNVNLDDIDFSDEVKLRKILEENPIIYAMFVEALFRTIEALQLQKKIKADINKDSSLVELLQAIGEAGIDKDYFETQLRGYFGEIYCTKTIVAGKIGDVVIRLQMPEASNEPGIDLIDPVTGMKIQVKTGEEGLIGEHFDKNWQETDRDPFSKSDNFFGLKKIPVLTVKSVKNDAYKGDDRVGSFGIEAKTVTSLIECFLDYRSHEEKLNTYMMINRLNSLLKSKDGDILSVNLPVWSLKNKLEKQQIAIQKSLRYTETSVAAAVLPENMGLVNRILQSKFGNAFIAATVIAFKEVRSSSEPSFVDLHQTAAGRLGAQQVASLANRYKITENDTLVTKIVKSIFGLIFKGASIVKHIAIDYRYIKASGIQEAINMFGNRTYMDEYGQIHIPPVLIVNDLQNYKGKLNPTGIKVNGRYIYQIKGSGILIYGAQGIDSEEISTAVNESQFIKEAVESMLREKGYEGISVEVEGVIQEEGTGIRFDRGITIIGTQELQNKTAEYVDGYVTSSVEIKRAVGMMYSQKALISLESIDDIEKLKQALTQGRARKIISKNQYDMLQLTEEEIIAMRKNGIEIYMDSNEIDETLKENGITGQIIRRGEQISVYDYYAQEEQAVEEVGEDKSLTDIESLLVNSQKPILIDIKVLAKKFQKENILGAYNGLNTLIGNIKLKTGIGQLNKTDIKSLGYNLDYNKLPELSLSKPLQKYSKEEIEDMLNTSILNAEPNSEIGIILKALGTKEELKQEFIQIMKERILAKTALKDNYKEFGLKDKNLEILLGQMLFKQLDFALENKDIEKEGNLDLTYVDQNGNIKEVTGEKEGLMRKITQDTEKSMRNDPVAINSIIEIILTYGDEYKEKQIARDMDKNDLRNYRAMMSAA